MAETIEIFSLKIDMDQAIKSTAELADETARLKIINDSLAKSSEATTEEQVQAKAAYDASNKTLKQNQRELTNLTSLRGKEIKTVQQGRNALAVLNKQWANSAKLYGANSKQTNALADQTLELTNRLKELEKGVGDNTRNVGNYAEGFKEALGSNNLFTRSMQNLTKAMSVGAPVVKAIKNEIGSAATQIKTAAVGTEAMTKAQKAAAITSNILSGALKILKVALISTGIGAIVVALGSLIAYFTNTQRGADMVSKAMAGLGAAFDVITDRLSLFGGALVKIFQGDFAGAFDDMTESVSGLGDEMQREINLALELEASLQKIDDKEIGLIQTQAERKKKIEELRLAAKDENTSLEERAELLQQAGDLEKAILDDQLQIATERARISQEQIDLGESTRDQIKENAEIQKGAIELQTQSLKLQRSIEAEKQGLLKRANAEQVAAQAKEIASAKKVTDQALKDSKTRLQIFIEENKGKTEVLAEGLVFFEERMNAEIDLETERFEAGKLNAIEYELALLQIKNKGLEDQANLTKEFADLEIEKEAERLEAKKEKDAEELALKQEASMLEFEAKQETRIAQDEWEFDILRTDLERQKAEEIAYAEKVGASTAIIEKKYAEIAKRIKQDESNAKLAAVSNTFGSVAELLGKESAAGKAAAIAQTTIQTYLGAQQAYTSLSVIPVYGPVLGAIAAAAAVASGLANIRKIVSTPKPTIPKLESGGLMSIGGNRHSSGGTKFSGEDGTSFEAERGELIGVMNRKAASSFMAFNDSFGPKGKSGNYFADGGIVNRSIQGLSGSGSSVGAIDYDLLAIKVAEANLTLPAPVVTVEDINSGQESVQVVESGASV